VTLLAGLATMGLLLLFALDSVQIRAQLPQNVKGNFMKVALRAGFVGVLLSTLFVWLGLTVGKVLKSQGSVRTIGGKEPAQEGLLVVGNREPARPNLRSIDSSEARMESKKDGTGGLSID